MVGKEKISKNKTNYFNDINKALNVQQIAGLIQYGSGVVIEHEGFLTREKAAKEKILNSIRKHNCNRKGMIDELEKFEKVIQTIYFEIGVQIGICMQVELLSEHTIGRQSFTEDSKK